jgi:GNAT superfamily N-acetyltransferase
VTGKRADGRTGKELAVEFTIEEVRDLDAAWPELERLILDSHQHYEPILGFGPPPNWRDEMRERLRPQPQTLILLATADGHGIGYANALVKSSGNGHDHVYIDNVYVLEAARGRGVGTAFYSRIAEWAAELDSEELRLHVWATNDPSVEFRTRRGFTAVEVSMVKRLGAPR